MKLNKFTRLPYRSFREAMLLLPAAAILLVTVGMMKILGFKKTMDRVRRTRPRHRGRAGNAESVDRAARAINRASRMTRAGTCLTRSLALHVLLCRKGVDATLRIGVRKGRGVIAAHAWLEYRGEPVGGDAAEAFPARFPPVPAGRIA